jgi:hypothetical protein
MRRTWLAHTAIGRLLAPIARICTLAVPLPKAQFPPGAVWSSAHKEPAAADRELGREMTSRIPVGVERAGSNDYYEAENETRYQQRDHDAKYAEYGVGQEPSNPAA